MIGAELRSTIRLARSQKALRAALPHRERLQQLGIACASCGVETACYTLGCPSCWARAHGRRRRLPDGDGRRREAVAWLELNREEQRQAASERIKGSYTCST